MRWTDKACISAVVGPAMACARFTRLATGGLPATLPRRLRGCIAHRVHTHIGPGNLAPRSKEAMLALATVLAGASSSGHTQEGEHALFK